MAARASGLVAFLVPAAGALTLLAGCDGRKRFTAEVELVRYAVVKRDDAGAPLTADVEIRYATCPGEQHEVARGGSAFAACMAAKKPGERLSAKVDWYKHRNGHYDWDLVQLGDCVRDAEPNDDGSFETVQECDPVVSHGAVTGFRCSRLPDKQLVARCPWFRRD